MPSAPKVTASTAWSSASIDTTTSPVQASATVRAGRAPSRASTLSCERLYAVTVCPAAIRLAAMAAPMLPSPTNPMSMHPTLTAGWENFPSRR